MAPTLVIAVLLFAGFLLVLALIAYAAFRVAAKREGGIGAAGGCMLGAVLIGAAGFAFLGFTVAAGLLFAASEEGREDARKLEFHERTIIVDVNGGGRPKKSWRDHIQFGMGGTMPTSSTTATGQDQGPPGFQQGMGGTIYLQFPKTVPDISPDELKSILAPFLDFSKERSASVHWIDTLPPEMKKAITERHPIIGMDRDEVVAAIGKPDRKVRERDAQGNDTEDWIYGHPPDKTVFVRFTGERVTGIKQYPQ